MLHNLSTQCIAILELFHKMIVEHYQQKKIILAISTNPLVPRSIINKMVANCRLPQLTNVLGIVDEVLEMQNVFARREKRDKYSCPDCPSFENSQRNDGGAPGQTSDCCNLQFAEGTRDSAGCRKDSSTGYANRAFAIVERLLESNRARRLLRRSTRLRISG